MFVASLITSLSVKRYKELYTMAGITATFGFPYASQVFKSTVYCCTSYFTKICYAVGGMCVTGAQFGELSISVSVMAYDSCKQL